MTRSAAIVLLFILPSITWADDKPIRLPDAEPATVGLDGKRLTLLDTAATDAITAKQCPGTVVLVVRQGKVVYRKAFGQRATEPKKEEMTTDTLFDLASLTKPIATAASIHLLVEKGKLKLDDPVAKHLPSFGKNGKDKITLEHLLLHTSGLPAGNAVANYENGRQKAIEKIGELKPTADPGKRFTYSDLGYILLGEIVAKVSGDSLDGFARKNLFEPMGLPEMTFRPDKKLHPRCAPTQKVKDDWLRGVVHDPRARALDGVAGHAGLFGSADDLAVFAQMLLDGGLVGKKRILSESSVKAYTAVHPIPKGKRTLGWDAQTSYSGNRGELFAGYGHTGFTGTSLWIDPPSKMAVIVLTNRVHPDGKGDGRRLRSRAATLAAQSITKAPFPEAKKDKKN